MSDDGSVWKKPGLDWILWWRIDQTELDSQVEQYDSLRFTRSMRGASVLCLGFSIAITVGFIVLGWLDLAAYVDVGLMGLLALFIYLGHRWAMLLAMVLWTLEKIMTLVGGFGPHQVGGGAVVSQLIWWCVYMHAFYFAFRIEQKRRAIAKAVGA